MKLTQKSILAFDTETTPRWWWYDGKATTRTMMFVGQWVNDGVDLPFGWIFAPDIVLHGLTRARAAEYEGLPLVSRAEGLRLVSRTIADADVLIGHNISGFDIGNLNGELKLLNLPLLDTPKVLDTLHGAHKVSGQSMSLANRLSRLPDAAEKPHVNPAVWEAAFHDFDPAALHEVWMRARADVRGHIDLYLNDTERGYLA